MRGGRGDHAARRDPTALQLRELMATNGERGDRREFDQTTSPRYCQIEGSGIDLQMHGTMSYE